MMKDLDNFLAECRECTRAITVKLDVQDYASSCIEDLLNVSASFIRTWRIQYRTYGIDSVYLQHQGSRGYLSSAERAEVIAFLMTKDSYSIEELCEYVDEQLSFAPPQKTLGAGTLAKTH